MTGLTDAPVPENRMETQMTVTIGNDVFIVVHTFHGTRTVGEIYEDFLVRKLKNSA